MAFLAILSGCVIKNLGYFEVDPFAKPFTSEIERPLNLVLMEDVQDQFYVDGVGWNKMLVSDFRRSFEASMKNVLDRNFQEIKVYDAMPEDGLSLVIYRVRPYWKVNTQDDDSGMAGLVSAAFQFESSLFLDNEKLQNADLTVYSDEQMSNVNHAHAVFKAGLVQTCETINKEIFPDRVVWALQQ